jgi:hypothetical protein
MLLPAKKIENTMTVDITHYFSLTSGVLSATVYIPIDRVKYFNGMDLIDSLDGNALPPITTQGLTVEYNF